MAQDYCHVVLVYSQLCLVLLLTLAMWALLVCHTPGPVVLLSPCLSRAHPVCWWLCRIFSIQGFAALDIATQTLVASYLGQVRHYCRTCLKQMGSLLVCTCVTLAGHSY